MKKKANGVSAASSIGSRDECVKPIINDLESEITGVTNAESSRSITFDGLQMHRIFKKSILC